MNTVLLALSLVSALLAVGFLVATSRAVRARRPGRSALSGLVALLCLVLALLLGVITVATTGYRALTREELAATVEVRPLAERRFEAIVELPDGRRDTLQLAGDELYVDAHILKWKSVANLLGLHTAYDLDRIGGRYADIASELDREKTVHSLGSDRPIDMFELARSVSWLNPLVDAQYGSGTFQRADQPAVWEVYVSTSGLLIREAGS